MNTGSIEPQAVRIEFHHEEAQAVAIIGSFTRGRTMPLLHVANGRWVRVVFLEPGPHEYRFVVDGRPEAGYRKAMAHPKQRRAYR